MYKYEIVENCHPSEGDDCTLYYSLPGTHPAVFATHLKRHNAEKIVEAFEILYAISNWWYGGCSPIHVDSLVIGDKSICDTIRECLMK